MVGIRLVNETHGSQNAYSINETQQYSEMQQEQNTFGAILAMNEQFGAENQALLRTISEQQMSLGASSVREQHLESSLEQKNQELVAFKWGKLAYRMLTRVLNSENQDLKSSYNQLVVGLHETREGLLSQEKEIIARRLEVQSLTEQFENGSLQALTAKYALKWRLRTLSSQLDLQKELNNSLKEELRASHEANQPMNTPSYVAPYIPLTSTQLKYGCIGAYTSYEAIIAPMCNLPLKYRPIAFALHKLKGFFSTESVQSVPVPVETLLPTNEEVKYSSCISVDTGTPPQPPISVPQIRVHG